MLGKLVLYQLSYHRIHLSDEVERVSLTADSIFDCEKQGT